MAPDSKCRVYVMKVAAAVFGLPFAASLMEESLSMNVLVLNPGGNSLKVELIFCSPGQQFAFAGNKLLSLTLEGIGKKPSLSVMKGKEVEHTEPMQAKDYGEAAANILSWLEEEKHINRSGIDCVGVRVVHGGRHFAQATVITGEVEQQAGKGGRGLSLCLGRRGRDRFRGRNRREQFACPRAGLHLPALVRFADGHRKEWHAH